MKTIWKYPLVVIDAIQRLEGVPKGAVSVKVDSQLGGPCLWMLVDTDAQPEPRAFKVVGTGQRIPDNGWYVGSWQAPPFVWHLFEVRI